MREGVALRRGPGLGLGWRSGMHGPRPEVPGQGRAAVRATESVRVQ